MQASMREAEECFADFDYYQFDGSETEGMFRQFCSDHKISYEMVSRFSAKENVNITSCKVPFASFTDAAADIDPDLDGNIEPDITIDIMKRLIK